MVCETARGHMRALLYAEPADTYVQKRHRIHSIHLHLDCDELPTPCPAYISPLLSVGVQRLKQRNQFYFQLNQLLLPGSSLIHKNMSTSSHLYSSDAEGRSPVPYLFGGLAAMLILLAMALLMLACSFRKMVGSDNISIASTPDMASEKDVEEDRVAVIMAGDERPTFLAMAIPKPVMT